MSKINVMNATEFDVEARVYAPDGLKSRRVLQPTTTIGVSIDRGQVCVVTDPETAELVAAAFFDKPPRIIVDPPKLADVDAPGQVNRAMTEEERVAAGLEVAGVTAATEGEAGGPESVRARDESPAEPADGSAPVDGAELPPGDDSRDRV